MNTKTFYHLYQGDTFKFLSTLDKKSVDLVILDPPYGLGSKKGGDDIDLSSNIILHTKLALELRKILKNNGSLYLFLSYRLLAYILPTFLENKYILKNLLIWYYANANVREKRNYAHCYDPVAFLVFNEEYYFDQDSIREPYETERVKYPVIKKGVKWKPNPLGRKRKNVIRIAQPRPAFSKEYLKHPWQKPEKLINIFIKASSGRGDVILDPFCGSGTTMKVAQDLGRSCIGVEINPRYCEMIKKRCFGKRYLDREVEYKFEVIESC